MKTFFVLDVFEFKNDESCLKITHLFISDESSLLFNGKENKHVRMNEDVPLIIDYSTRYGRKHVNNVCLVFVHIWIAIPRNIYI